MPFYPPFNIPFFYSNYNFPRNSHNSNHNTLKNTESPKNVQKQEKKASADSVESTEAFFEIFGLKLYFDDILIICILFFLYTERVHDEELFICLIMLLLT